MSGASPPVLPKTGLAVLKEKPAQQCAIRISSLPDCLAAVPGHSYIIYQKRGFI